MLNAVVDSSVKEAMIPLESGLSFVKIIDYEMIAVERSKAPKKPMTIRIGFYPKVS